VAQHTLMLMLSLAARLPLYQQDLAAGAWQQSPFFCLLNHSTVELAGKQLVLVGEGTLGREVARLAQAFGMQVRFAARPGSDSDSRPTLDELLPTADVLSFHCPLTDETRHLLDNERLQRIKPGCLVVNCARGGILDEQAALDALSAGLLGGLAVDVLPVEPPRDGHPLLDALQRQSLNLIVTPHNAWISPQARQNIIRLTAENIDRLAAGWLTWRGRCRPERLTDHPFATIIPGKSEQGGNRQIRSDKCQPAVGLVEIGHGGSVPGQGMAGMNRGLFRGWPSDGVVIIRNNR
jgi:glycerate dehydrogenase